MRSLNLVKTVNIKANNQFVSYSIPTFYDKSYWRKCRVMRFRLLSKLKKYSCLKYLG